MCVIVMGSGTSLVHEVTYATTSMLSVAFCFADAVSMVSMAMARHRILWIFIIGVAYLWGDCFLAMGDEYLF